MDGFMVLLVVLGFIAALLLGLLAGAWVVSRQYGTRLRETEADFDGVSRRLGEVTSALAAAEAENRLLTGHNERLSVQAAQDNSVLQALAPVAEKLAHVQAQVGVLERDRVEQFGQLAEQLQAARHADEQLLLTTQSLASALRNNSARGKWGEVQLRRIVEAAGMLPYVDFHEQVSASGADGTGRPDMVVRLPGRKELVVDSKVPLSAFLQAQDLPESGGELEARRRSELLAQHAKAVKAHVDALGQKKYWNGAVNSPELVICFIPAESFLGAALTADPELLEYAFARNVALASPVSLLATLKAVAFTWRQDVLTENAKELFELSRQLYERLGTMGDHVTKLGNSLKTSVERYNSFVGTLESRVLPTARKINAFDPATLDKPAAPLTAVESTPRVLGAPELLADPEAAERSA